MPALRTRKSQEIYDEYMANGALDNGCPLCEAKPVKEFEGWKIIVNRFPYDTIANKHHMLVPKRHATEAELNEDEKSEFSDLKTGYVAKNYEYMMEATTGIKSIPAHFHLHLLTFLEEMQS